MGIGHQNQKITYDDSNFETSVPARKMKMPERNTSLVRKDQKNVKNDQANNNLQTLFNARE